MVVTLQTPKSNERIGPGYRLTLRSDFIGPIPVFTVWTIVLKRIGAEPGLGIILDQQFPVGTLDQHLLDVVIGDLSVPQQTDVGNQVNVAEGDDIHLQVILNAPAPIDSALYQMKWDPTGRLFAMPGLGAGSVTGGFTGSDRDLLELIANSVRGVYANA